MSNSTMAFKVIALLVWCAALSSESLAKPDPRIVGGFFGKIEDFPYQLSLKITGRHNCGASIIGRRWVLTAAHCLEKRTVEEVSFRGGSTAQDSGGIVVKAAKLFTHPLYNKRFSDYDVGLVQTKSDLVGENVQPIRISMNGDDVPYGKYANVSGWGYEVENGTVPTNLKYTQLKIMDQQACDIAMKDFGGVRGSMFCAQEPGTDACQGDSGGPIVYNKVQIGVVSWGIGCGDSRYPGVFTRMGNPSVRAWILNIAKF